MAILAQEPPVSSDMYEFEILLLVVYLLGLSSGVLLSWALHGGSVVPALFSLVPLNCQQFVSGG